MVRNVLIEAQAGAPAVGQVHPNIFDQAPLAGDSIEYPISRMRGSTSGIDGRTPSVTVALFQCLTHESEVDSEAVL